MSARAWCVVNQGGQLITSTLHPLRVGSIKLMVGRDEGWRNNWRWWKRQFGCRCVRVNVEAADPTPTEAAGRE